MAIEIGLRLERCDATTQRVFVEASKQLSARIESLPRMTVTPAPSADALLVEDRNWYRISVGDECSFELSMLDLSKLEPFDGDRDLAVWLYVAPAVRSVETYWVMLLFVGVVMDLRGDPDESDWDAWSFTRALRTSEEVWQALTPARFETISDAALALARGP